MPELFIEILSEEIPASMQEKASNSLGDMLESELKKFNFPSPILKDEIQTYVTPRRLVAFIKDVPSVSPSRRDIKRGPRVGSPEIAVSGFASSVGVKKNQLNIKILEGNEYYLFEKIIQERNTTDHVGEMIQRIIASFSWPKSMRWHYGSSTWVRPIRSILCIFDKEVINGDISFLSIDNQNEVKFKIDNFSYGHRSFSLNPIKILNFDDYRKKILEHKVIIDFSERKEIIEKGAKSLAEQAGLKLRDDPALLAETAGLTEWPVPLMGSIDKDFITLPPEILIVSMRSHQKYFATEDSKGRLADKFIVISGTESEDNGIEIISGNERVLRARLSDAKFFLDQDLSVPLQSRMERLKDIVFHAKLGNLEEKTKRVQSLALSLCGWVEGAGLDNVTRAALLAKADLSTGLVGEFPELQGIVGKYYAAAEGEPEAVSKAIAEQYSPKGPDDICPSSPVSVVLALADRIDSLVGFWSINEKPTGSKDPFALRRAAIGVIRLIIENKISIPLVECLKIAGATEKLAKNIFLFFEERLRVYLREKGYGHDVINSVLKGSEGDDLHLSVFKIENLDSFLKTSAGSDLLAAYRRVSSMVRLDDSIDLNKEGQAWDISLMTEEQELVLAKSLINVREKFEYLNEVDNFLEIMKIISQLRSPIDNFFENVTVNIDNQSIKNNRLYLLSDLEKTMNIVTDFSLIEG